MARKAQPPLYKCKHIRLFLFLFSFIIFIAINFKPFTINSHDFSMHWGASTAHEAAGAHLEIPSKSPDFVDQRKFACLSHQNNKTHYVLGLDWIKMRATKFIWISTHLDNSIENTGMDLLQSETLFSKTIGAQLYAHSDRGDVIDIVPIRLRVGPQLYPVPLPASWIVAMPHHLTLIFADQRMNTPGTCPVIIYPGT